MVPARNERNLVLERDDFNIVSPQTSIIILAGHLVTLLRKSAETKMQQVYLVPRELLHPVAASLLLWMMTDLQTQTVHPVMAPGELKHNTMKTLHTQQYHDTYPPWTLYNPYRLPPLG